MLIACDNGRSGWEDFGMDLKPLNKKKGDTVNFQLTRMFRDSMKQTESLPGDEPAIPRLSHTMTRLSRFPFLKLLSKQTC